jgi:hypothetical protein
LDPAKAQCEKVPTAKIQCIGEQIIARNTSVAALERIEPRSTYDKAALHRPLPRSKNVSLAGFTVPHPSPRSGNDKSWSICPVFCDWNQALDGKWIVQPSRMPRSNNDRTNPGPLLVFYPRSKNEHCGIFQQ